MNTSGSTPTFTIEDLAEQLEAFDPSDPDPDPFILHCLELRARLEGQREEVVEDIDFEPPHSWLPPAP